MRHALAYLSLLLVTTVHVYATPTLKDEFKKIHLWGEHAVKDVENAVSMTFDKVSSAIENIEPVKGFTDFRHAVQEMVDSVYEMHNIANSRGAVQIDLHRVSTELSQKVDEIIQQLVLSKQAFLSEPHPDDKTEAYKMVDQAVVLTLDKVEDAVVAVYVGIGIPESGAREMFAHAQPHIKHAVLALYKLGEEHPEIATTAVAMVITMLVPEDFFILPIMRVFGWGTKGPVKGSVAAWIQRVFFPASIPKGSWFSQLQKLGMSKL